MAAYRVSIITFISRKEKEKGLGPIPYFGAIIDFLFVENHYSYFCTYLFLPEFDLFVLFHNFSETWLTICD